MSLRSAYGALSRVGKVGKDGERPGEETPYPHGCGDGGSSVHFTFIPGPGGLSWGVI